MREGIRRPKPEVGMHLVTALALAGIGAGLAMGQQPVLSLTATADNAGSIKIDVLRWSTDAERDQLLTAWTQPGAGRGRGAAAPAEDPFGGSNDAVPGRGAAGGRGGGRGGRGGNAASEAVPRTPEASLAAALANAPTLGYLWSAAEVSGYALRYAAQFAAPDGSDRIVLITDRRLGAWNDLWKPADSGGAAKYDFSLVELRLKSKGAGEGKTSLSGGLAADTTAKTFTLDNYAGLPVMLKSVTRR